MSSYIEAQLQAVLERNRRVEAEKAWEISFTRRGFLFLLTYLIAWFFLAQLDLPSPHFQALIPAGAYMLSTLSLPWLKKLWMNKKGLLEDQKTEHKSVTTGKAGSMGKAPGRG